MYATEIIWWDALRLRSDRTKWSVGFLIINSCILLNILKCQSNILILFSSDIESFFIATTGYLSFYFGCHAVITPSEYWLLRMCLYVDNNEGCKSDRQYCCRSLSSSTNNFEMITSNDWHTDHFSTFDHLTEVGRFYSQTRKWIYTHVWYEMPDFFPLTEGMPFILAWNKYHWNICMQVLIF